MRFPTGRRFFGLVAAVIVLVGCNGKPKSSAGVPRTIGTTGGATGARPAKVEGPTARQAAETVLKDLGAGKISPDRLTANFKKAIAPPGRDTDQFAQGWLEQFRGATYLIGEENQFGDSVAVRGLAKFPMKSMAFSFRLVQSPAGYQVDWLHRSERQGAEIKTPAGPELAAAQDAVRNFLDLLLGGDVRQVHPLMAPAWRKALSPPGPQDQRQGYDYGPGFLDGKLRAWKSDFLAYTLNTGDLGPNKGTATFTATMDSGGTKTAYTVRAVKDPTSGDWLVSEFEKQ